MLAQMGRHKPASDVFDGVGHLLPHSGVPPMLLGNLHFAKGKLALAEKAQRDAVAREAGPGCLLGASRRSLALGRSGRRGARSLSPRHLDCGRRPIRQEFASNLIEAQELGCFDVED